MYHHPIKKTFYKLNTPHSKPASNLQGFQNLGGFWY